MKLSAQDVRYVADLANLELSAAERERLVTELGSILEYVEQLNSLDTGGVEPMAQLLYRQAENETLRDDAPQDSYSQERALANAPESGAAQFKAPRVIER